MTSLGMSATATRRTPVPDVVAVLMYDDVAGSVAKAAVREAVSRGARVRFLHVVDAGLSETDRIVRDQAALSAALRALRESPRVPVTFEIAEGVAGPAVIARARDAAVLVVGRDRADGSPGVAGHCQSHARCDVLTVNVERAQEP